MACPDESLLLAFIEGRLPPARVAEIEKHVSGCGACSELVVAAAPAVLSESPPATKAVQTPASAVAGEHAKAEAPAPFARGATVGRYVILTLVGRGGMGDVYAAYDPELDRKVALKLLKDVGSTAEARARSRSRLLREAKAIAKLSHPNVVVVYDAGTIDDRAFIAMEFVEGQTLRAWLGHKPHAWAEVRAMFLAAGHGLASAHAARIVHRDFKPHNVMVTPDGAVKVMDFGQASQAGDDDGDAGPLEPVSTEHADFARTMTVAMTRTGPVSGTPAYMAPEQFLAQPADARTDQFSFCVVLYQALYGERPFAGATIPEMSEAVTEGRLREPPARVRVPAWLRKLLLRGLRTHRDERFPTMDALLTALARDPERQRRQVTIAAAVAALLLVGGALAQRKLGASQAALCHAAGDRLAGVWELPGTGGAAARREAVRKAFLASGARKAEQVWERTATLLDRYAQGWAAMYGEACEATHTRGEQSPEVLDLRMACLNQNRDSLRALADVFTHADAAIVGQAIDATSALPEVARCADVSVLRAVIPPPADGKVRARVGDIRQRVAEIRAHALATGQYKHDVVRAQPVLAEARAAGYEPLVAEVNALLGWLYTALRDTTLARQGYEQALWTAEAVRHDEIGAEAAVQLVAIAGTFLRLFDEAERWASLGESILKRMGAGHDRLWGWLYNNRGGSRLQARRLDEAVEDLSKAIAFKQKADGGDSADVGISVYSLAEVHARQGDYAAALREADRALVIFDRAYGPGAAESAHVLNNRCEYLNVLNRFEEALVPCRESLGVAREAGQSEIITTYPLTATGVALLGLRRAKEAVEPLEQALRIREGRDGNGLIRAETRFALARALWESGQDRARARSLAESARAEYAKSPGAERESSTIDAWLAVHAGGASPR